MGILQSIIGWAVLLGFAGLTTYGTYTLLRKFEFFNHKNRGGG